MKPPFVCTVEYCCRQYERIPVPSFFSVSESKPAPFVTYTPSCDANTMYDPHGAIERASAHPIWPSGCKLMFSPVVPGGTFPTRRSVGPPEKPSMTPWIDATPDSEWLKSTYAFEVSHVDST